MAGRTLRPRGEVDYSAKSGQATTPGWLKKGTAKASSDQKDNHKENKEPLKEETAAVKEAKGSKAKAAAEKVNKAGAEDQGADSSSGKKRQREEGSRAASRKKRITKSAPEAVTELDAPPEVQPEKTKSGSSTESKAAKKSRKSKTDTHPKDEGEGPKKDRVSTKSANVAPTKDAEQQQAVTEISPAKTRSGKTITRTDEGRLEDEPSTHRILTPSKKPPSPTKEPSQEAIPASAREPKEAVTGVTSSAAEPQVATQRDTFQALQEEYTALHSKYQEVKAQRIQEVEDVILEIKAQEQAHTQKALQLAAHWEAEAQRQAAIAQHGDVVALQGRVDEQDKQLANLQELLLDTQTQVLEKEEENNELRRKLGELIRLVEQFQDSVPEQLSEEDEPEMDLQEVPSTEAVAQPASIAAVGVEAILDQGYVDIQSASEPSIQQQPRLTSPSKKLPSSLQVQSVLNSARAAHRQESQGLISQALTPANTSSVEAKAVDGNLQTSQAQLSGQQGAATPSTEGVYSKALVPYANSISMRQILSNYQTATNNTAANPDLPDNDVLQDIPAVADHVVEASESGMQGKTTAMNDALLQLVREYEDPASATLPSAQAQAQQANSPAVGRHLNFTPGTGNTRTAENSNRNSNNQLPLAALPGNEAMVQTGNSHMPVQAKTSSGTPSNESQGLSMGGISNITNKGLINLVGLTIAAPRPRGGFSYTHPPTGFIFEIVNDDSDSEDEAGSLVFNPLSFGTAEELLPSYLKYEIKFAPEMRLKLVSRIMEHLGRSEPQPGALEG